MKRVKIGDAVESVVWAVHILGPHHYKGSRALELRLQVIKAGGLRTIKARAAVRECRNEEKQGAAVKASCNHHAKRRSRPRVHSADCNSVWTSYLLESGLSHTAML